MDSEHQITELLLKWEQGDESALERLLPLVMKELKRLARSYMRKERAGHTLQTTALVNEAYIKLVNQKRVRWKNRNQFFGIAALCMRRILMSYAVARAAEKRGGGLEHTALVEAELLSKEKAFELIALDGALEKLAEQDARQAKIIELRYFGGYTVEEVAELLEISPETVYLDSRMAYAWLRRELQAEPATTWTDES